MAASGLCPAGPALSRSGSSGSSGYVFVNGFDFVDATAVFDDDLAITIREHSSGEERFVTLGTDSFSRLLVLV